MTKVAMIGVGINNIMNNAPYTYIVGWSKLKKYYYGVRYARKCSPDDLWQTYFTSSDEVKSFRKLHGEPDIIQIRKIFSSTEAAIKWEQKVLKRMKVITNEHFLNKNDRLAPPINNRITSSDTKDKIRKGRLGKTHSDEAKQKIRLARAKQTNIGLRGKKLSEEAIAKIKAARTKQVITVDTRKKMRNSHLGVKHPMITCPHCQLSGGARAMKRYHFDNCKKAK